MPYVRVLFDGEVTHTDAEGRYTFDNEGLAPVSVAALLVGEWFTVIDH